MTGLVFADLVMSMDFQRKCKDRRLSTIATAGLCMAAGYIMMFVWSTISARIAERGTQLPHWPLSDWRHLHQEQFE